MDAEHLVHQANRIAEFFAAMPDRADAVDGVAQHLRRYWAPRMRQALLAHLDRTGGTGLEVLVRDALLAYRPSLTSSAYAKADISRPD